LREVRFDDRADEVIAGFGWDLGRHFGCPY
jgi:hypothetical protein